MKKRMMRLIFLSCLLCLIIPVKTMAADVVATGSCGENVEWELDNAGTMYISGSGDMEDYSDASMAPWDQYREDIQSLVVEQDVTSIGVFAFEECSNLEEIILPASLTNIGGNAFYGCTSLKKMNIPEGLFTIHDYTFKNCRSLESIRLSKSLIKIGQGAFENCTALTYVFIPGDTEIIGSWSFKGCTGLEEVDMQWADATKIREGAFKNCSSLTEILLPADIRVLGDSCFYGIGAASFTVPATVTSVETWCFARAKVSEIIFEGDAPAIGEGAFNKISFTAYYPEGNETWIDAVMQNYGGEIIWKAR